MAWPRVLLPLDPSCSILAGPCFGHSCRLPSPMPVSWVFPDLTGVFFTCEHCELSCDLETMDLVGTTWSSMGYSALTAERPSGPQIPLFPWAERKVEGQMVIRVWQMLSSKVGAGFSSLYASHNWTPHCITVILLRRDSGPRE